MDFSESFRCSGPPPCFSPDGRFVATVVGHRLIIREVDSLRVVQLYACLDAVDCVDWSPSSLYVACGLCARGIVQIWSVDSPDWSCKIDEGPAGVRSVRWSPDGSSVLAVAEFGLRVTVWSLVDRKCTYLAGPKHDAGGRGLAFSADGAHLAVLERSDMKDWVSVYDTRTWAPAARWAVPGGVSDAADLSWSPAGGVLAVWDSCLGFKVVAVDARDGQLLGSFSPEDYHGLGVKSCSWSPGAPGAGGGELLAVGSFDRTLRLLNHVNWQPLLEGLQAGPVEGPARVVVYREELDEQPGPGATPTAASRSKYVIAQLPAAVPSMQPPLDAPTPKLGIGRVSWSGDGRWVAALEDSCPSTVWVWDVEAMELGAVLLHLAPVTDLAWGPAGSTLAVATGATKVHLWTPAGASIVHVPLASFQAFGCSWNNTATTLLLRGAEAFCCAYLTA